MSHEEIGRGSQSVVYKITIGKTEMAVKELKQCRDLLDLEKEFDKSELFTPLYFRHPNLVEMYGFGVGLTRHDNSLYIVMGLKDFSLDAFLEEAVAERVSISPKVMVRMGRQMLSALMYLHSNDVVHGHVMPENVLLERISSTRYKIVMSNFGISPKVEAQQRSRTTGDAGLRQFFPYWSPEAFSGLDESGENFGKKDVYAFGVTLWELVATMWTLQPNRYSIQSKNFVQAMNLAKIMRPPLALLPDCCHDFFSRTWEVEPSSRYTAAQAYDAITVIRELAKMTPPPPSGSCCSCS